VRILTVTRACQRRGKNPFYLLTGLMEAAMGAFPVFYTSVSVVGEPRFFPRRTAVMG